MHQLPRWVRSMALILSLLAAFSLISWMSMAWLARREAQRQPPLVLWHVPGPAPPVTALIIPRSEPPVAAVPAPTPKTVSVKKGTAPGSAPPADLLKTADEQGKKAADADFERIMGSPH